MPHFTVPLTIGALVLLARAPESAAQTASGANVEQCLSDHVAGQEANLDGHLLTARSKLQACADAGCPSQVAEACAALLRDIEPRIPSLVLTARDAEGRDVVDATLSIDGAPVPLTAWGRAREVEAGTHEITLERSGKVIARATAVVAEGEKNRRVNLQGAAAPALSAPNHVRTAGFAFAGLGAAALVGSAILGALTVSEYNTLESTCAPNCTDQGAVTRLKGRALATDLLLGGGLAFAAAGGLMIFWPRPGAKREEPRASLAPYVVIGDKGAFGGVVVKAF